MLGYVTLGTTDLTRAATFYDALAAELGCRRIMDNDLFVAWGPPDGGPGLSLSVPDNGQPPGGGNGIVIALIADDRAAVDRVHALAVQLGARSDGPPSERFTGYYAGDFHDADGNHLSVFTMG